MFDGQLFKTDRKFRTDLMHRATAFVSENNGTLEFEYTASSVGPVVHIRTADADSLHLDHDLVLPWLGIRPILKFKLL